MYKSCIALYFFIWGLKQKQYQQIDDKNPNRFMMCTQPLLTILQQQTFIVFYSFVKDKIEKL